MSEAAVSTDQARRRSSTNQAVNRDRPLRLLTHHRHRVSSENHGTRHSQDISHSKESTPPSPSDYGYLEHIRSFKDLCKPDDKSLKKKIRLLQSIFELNVWLRDFWIVSISTLSRGFYEDQLEFITSLEAILLPKSDDGENNATLYQKRQERTIKILTIVTLITNIVCHTSFLFSSAFSLVSFTKDSGGDQNRGCSHFQVAFGDFVRSRQRGGFTHQCDSHLDSTQNQETRCLSVSDRWAIANSVHTSLSLPSRTNAARAHCCCHSLGDHVLSECTSNIREWSNPSTRCGIFYTETQRHFMCQFARIEYECATDRRDGTHHWSVFHSAIEMILDVICFSIEDDSVRFVLSNQESNNVCFGRR